MLRRLGLDVGRVRQAVLQGRIGPGSGDKKERFRIALPNSEFVARHNLVLGIALIFVFGVHDREQARDDDSGSSQAVSRAVSTSRLIAIIGMTAARS